MFYFSVNLHTKSYAHLESRPQLVKVFKEYLTKNGGIKKLNQLVQNDAKLKPAKTTNIKLFNFQKREQNNLA
jgi:hypothetical protein